MARDIIPALRRQKHQSRQFWRLWCCLRLWSGVSVCTFGVAGGVGGSEERARRRVERRRKASQSEIVGRMLTAFVTLEGTQRDARFYGEIDLSQAAASPQRAQFAGEVFAQFHFICADFVHFLTPFCIMFDVCSTFHFHTLLHCSTKVAAVKRFWRFFAVAPPDGGTGGRWAAGGRT